MRTWCAATLLLVLAACGGGEKGSNELPGLNGSRSLQVTSSSFADGGRIPARFTCDGADVSPRLAWTGGSDVRTYVVFVTDEDAPGGTFVHWAVAGIPGTVTSIGEGFSDPDVKVAKNDFDSARYNGQCPPEGDSAHRYVITVYGLNAIPADGFPGDVGALLDAIRCCIAARGELTANYAR